MLNKYSSEYLAGQHRDELFREAERERLGQAVTASDTVVRAAEAPDARRVSLLARIRRAFHGHHAAPAAGKSL